MRISPRRAAAKLKEAIYHTGKPCPYGHNDGRYTRTAGCVVCAKEAAARQRREIAELMAEPTP